MTANRAIARKSLPDTIANDLRERILSGELAEGAPIRQETLAAEYDVSRMPIREALKRLDAEGLVQLTTNKGATVTQHSLRDIGEIFDLRALIEVELFRIAIPNMTPQHIEDCAQTLTRMEASYYAGDVATWGALNSEYHAALYAPAQRSLSQDVLQPLNQKSDRYVRMQLSVTKDIARAKDEHRELLALATQKDVEAACALLRKHIHHAKEDILQFISNSRCR
ncbi:GntR family transcriptional regulator [Epibacterium ulvae]|uniref:GntR family transcriptional regulator n=1 Tax=Epibacterium ulvae TaxID=1156985 RepID=UPI001BFC970D|nr:GntR family transcriptional regulator [Epibacterium ulvae]MBT8154092.1 GntR family transcriptional regulator [Epibacterium ulvae]